MPPDALKNKTILVTGATGFLGRQVVAKLIEAGHDLVATSRQLPEDLRQEWADHVRFIPYEMGQSASDPAEVLGRADIVMHLAWGGLQDYQSEEHTEVFLPESYALIKRMVETGTQRILAVGTCFEYGMQHGPLSEDMPTKPQNSYGIAKDILRKELQSIQSQFDFSLAWIRLFYMYGPYQHADTIIAQLDAAFDEGQETFNMSGGEQLRDYLPVEEVARRLVSIASRPDANGIFNCCSGEPISIRRLVENRIAERGMKIDLNLGHYPYPEYEPMAFWGCAEKSKAYFDW